MIEQGIARSDDMKSIHDVKIIAIGSGPILISLIQSLLYSGFDQFQVLNAGSVITSDWSFWTKAIRPFDLVVYTSQEGNINELRALQKACIEEGKRWLPAICFGRIGMAGPLVNPTNSGCWESAWRRLHRSAIMRQSDKQAYLTHAGSLLANVITSDLAKELRGETEEAFAHTFYLLDFDTLEGDRYSYLPHPLATGDTPLTRMSDYELKPDNIEAKKPSGLLDYFIQLTSPVTGIFHSWEEEDLLQLPLSQCRVQAADPLSEGPADLLSDIVCAGVTHEEARREAGLAGLEAYVSRICGTLNPSLYVGAGETWTEGVVRGLQKYLDEELIQRLKIQKSQIRKVQLDRIEDQRCQYYLEAVTTLQGPPTIGFEEVIGFPAVWVSTGGNWYVSAGIDTTSALRKALQNALQQAQNNRLFLAHASDKITFIPDEQADLLQLPIPSMEELSLARMVETCLTILAQNGKQLLTFDLSLEPFIQEGPIKMVGVQLKEVKSV